jgi:DNA-directed RNA polymerase subunit beta
MPVKAIQRSTFGIKYNQFPVPDLNRMQIESYKNFWDTGIQDVLAEFSPIEDSVGNRWRVELGPEYVLEDSNYEDAYQALVNNVTYGSRLSVAVKVENLVTKEKKTQNIYIGNIPLMTRKGDFVVNGTQKIVVGQLVKSPGVVFSRNFEKGIEIYSSKIIPNRGIWIEFFINQDNVIYTKIDRKKKFPVTQLLRLFGLVSENEIMDLFKDVDTQKDISFIQATLNKDSSYTVEDAVNSIYKKIRPGDIVSIEQGKRYLLSMFEDVAKYDFGKVGRYKFNTRVKYKCEPTPGFDYKRTIGVQEIIAVIKEMIRMKVRNLPEDSIDSLGNRRIRTVGEWIANTFKAGLARVARNTRDRMTTSEDTNFSPTQLVNMRPLAAMIEDFFNTSQLARFMDQTNIMSEMDDRTFLTSTGPGGLTKERAGFEVRDVHPSHYGRLCPINTPEGASFGLNTHLAIYSRVNKMGFLETPYFKVKNTLKASDPQLLSRTIMEDVVVRDKRRYKAGQIVNQNLQEELKAIDPNSEIKVKTLGARKNGSPVQASIDEVGYIDVAPNQILSLSTCMIPFIAQTDGYRVLMGTNQQGQALPLVKPENPLVATGFEKIAADHSGYLIKAEFDGIVVYADGFKVEVKDKDSGHIKTYKTIKYLPSNDHSAVNQKVLVSTGENVKEGDPLIEGFGIHQGEFAIGQNVRVAFMPFKGYNFEDAIVLSKNLTHQDKFTSNHIYPLICDIHETRLGNEEITRDIPNVPTEKLRKLDEDGIIHVGSYVESGDILVGKITPKGEVDLSPEDKLIRVLFGEYSRDVKDSSLYLEHGLNGKVISVHTFSRENGDSLPNDIIKRVHVWLAVTRKIKPGDKMAGRHGNKGVVSVIMPVEDMPYDKDGNSIDVILNPLGVIGRMNLGQLLEAHLGLVCEKKGLKALTQPLNEISWLSIKEELVKAGYSQDGKIDLWDGQTGEKYDRPVVVGNLYLNKLHHLVDDKVHTRSTGPYSLVTQQPLGGRSHSGGQRFGEMEVWALEAYGAAHALQEMLTIKSDDSKGRNEALNSIVKGKPILSPNLPGSFVVLANELTALAIKVNAEVTKSDAYDSIKMDEKLALSADEGKL